MMLTHDWLHLVLFLALCTAPDHLCAAASGSKLPPPKNGSVYVIAHRGAHLDIPENTLAAYRRAIELGVDFVEIDVRTTADSHWVSLHNASLQAYVENDYRKVSDLTLAQIRSLDVGRRVGDQWQGTRIATLEEIVELCKGRCGIYMDIKSAHIPSLISYLESQDMLNSVLLYVDLNEPLLASATRRYPHARFMPDPGPEKNLPQLFQVYRPAIVATVWEHCSASFVHFCHQRDALVFMDEDRPEDWARALRWGVDGIQTDDPERLIRFLKTL